MRKMMLIGSVCLLAALGSGPFAQSAYAQNANNGVQNNLRGKYAFQFTGIVNAPAPLDQSDGPMYKNGILVADGAGHFTADSMSSYNGTVHAENFTGTYVFGNNDGTFTITINDLDFPGLPHGAVQFTISGVLANQGTIAKVVVSGFSVAGHPQQPIGSVITGELIKQ